MFRDLARHGVSLSEGEVQDDGGAVPVEGLQGFARGARGKNSDETAKVCSTVCHQRPKTNTRRAAWVGSHGVANHSQSNIFTRISSRSHPLGQTL